LSMQRGRPGEAAELLGRAITVEPNSAALHNELGTNGPLPCVRVRWRRT
jgi:hypothetical protein